MRFSKKTAWELGENALTTRVRERRESGREVVDLTVSNPTECGFVYEADKLLSPLAAREAMDYEPQPFGLERARAGVAQYYREHGAEIPVANLCLTTSTSEAYSYLFRLLCDPGDEVLIARPSYPLFDFIARLDSVELREYPLHYDPGACADPAALRIRAHRLLRRRRGPSTSTHCRLRLQNAHARLWWCIPIIRLGTMRRMLSACSSKRCVPSADWH